MQTSIYIYVSRQYVTPSFSFICVQSIYICNYLLIFGFSPREKIIDQMAAGGGEGVSLEYTPTWVVALVCTVIVAISLVAERVLHYAGKVHKNPT